MEKTKFKTVKIGDQIWMAENLNVSTFRNGYPIPRGYSNGDWVLLQDYGSAWCYYENDPDNGKKYGKLYNWFAVNDPRGLAPEGWHVPNDVEWQKLIDYLGGDEFAGAVLKSSNYEVNINDNKSGGFSALLGGYRHDKGHFAIKGYAAYFWSSTELNSDYAWYRFLDSNSSYVHRSNYSKFGGFSVRLVMD